MARPGFNGGLAEAHCANLNLLAAHRYERDVFSHNTFISSRFGFMWIFLRGGVGGGCVEVPVLIQCGLDVLLCCFINQTVLTWNLLMSLGLPAFFRQF